MIYFISDMHFGHKGSLLWQDGTVRPEFKDIDEMDKTIIDNWNSVVTNEDIVYVLGDFAYKCSESKIRYIFDSLNGEIILIRGNHDNRVLKVNKKKNRFKEVHQYLELEYNNQWFILFHYPIKEWNNKFHDSIHLHGHTHERIPNIEGKIMNVSVEQLNYTPISIEEIISKFKKDEKK